MNGGLSKDEYRELIGAALPSSSDADTTSPGPPTLFTPDSHRSALDPDVTLVLGARGVGKTVWFKALQDRVLRELAADEYELGRLKKVNPLAGYGAELKPSAYPGPSALRKMMEDSVDQADLWNAVLLQALGCEEISALSNWPARVSWVGSNPDLCDQLIADADERAGREGETHLLLFDALDRLHRSRQEASILIEGILQLSLELRTRTRNIRSKIFIRTDMYDSLVLRFADASKLTANMAHLKWTEPNLYGLFFHMLGNANEKGSELFRSSTGRWQQRGDRFSPPQRLVADRDFQKDVFTRIAGDWMGRNHRKGHTYTWLPNHLLDGSGEVSPRSFLQALVRASEYTRSEMADHPYALHWEGIRRGVQDASRTRVDEISEDLPWVELVMAPLSGLQVPIDQEQVIERWHENGLEELLRQLASPEEVDSEVDVTAGPRSTNDLRELINELREIGVMRLRATGKLDLPDVYRIAFGLGRMGGVPRLAR